MIAFIACLALATPFEDSDQRQPPKQPKKLTNSLKQAKIKKIKASAQTGEPYSASGEAAALEPMLTEMDNKYLTLALNKARRGKKIPKKVMEYLEGSKRLMNMLKTLQIKSIINSQEYKHKRSQEAHYALFHPAKPMKEGL